MIPLRFLLLLALVAATVASCSAFDPNVGPLQHDGEAPPSCTPATTSYYPTGGDPTDASCAVDAAPIWDSSQPE